MALAALHAVDCSGQPHVYMIRHQSQTHKSRCINDTRKLWLHTKHNTPLRADSERSQPHIYSSLTASSHMAVQEGTEEGGRVEVRVRMRHLSSFSHSSETRVTNGQVPFESRRTVREFLSQLQSEQLLREGLKRPIVQWQQHVTHQAHTLSLDPQMCKPALSDILIKKKQQQQLFVNIQFIQCMFTAYYNFFRRAQL